MNDEKPIPPVGAPIAGQNHVARLLKGKHVENGVVNGAGFLTRPDEDAPSVNWLEWFDPPLEEQLKGVRSACRLTVTHNWRLAVMNVEHTASYIKANDESGLELLFLHDPLGADAGKGFSEDASHAVIQGVPVEETPQADAIKDLLAHCVILPLHAAKI